MLERRGNLATIDEKKRSLKNVQKSDMNKEQVSQAPWGRFSIEVEKIIIVVLYAEEDFRTVQCENMSARF